MVLFHTMPSVVPGGYDGVDVFFVISGFLITRLIASGVEAQDFNLVSFYLRRARRLLPAAFVCFAVTAAVSVVILLPDALLYFGASLMAALASIANYHF